MAVRGPANNAYAACVAFKQVSAVDSRVRLLASRIVGVGANQDEALFIEEDGTVTLLAREGMQAPEPRTNRHWRHAERPMSRSPWALWEGQVGTSVVADWRRKFDAAPAEFKLTAISIGGPLDAADRPPSLTCPS